MEKLWAGIPHLFSFSFSFSSSSSSSNTKTNNHIQIQQLSPLMDLISSSSSPLLLTTIIFLAFSGGSWAATFTLVNRCDHNVWPGILGSTRLESTGFQLEPGRSRSVRGPEGWSGRIWGRTGCAFAANTSQGSCTTGDCGSNQMECNGAGPAPPASLVEFSIGSSGRSGIQDFYYVSLVDGFNLPMMVVPSGGLGACGSTGCVADLNQQCPTELRGRDGQVCQSACQAFGTPEYCCSGAYDSPSTCTPSVYSKMFKSACPRSYSYMYDDTKTKFTCTGADYEITFCPSITSQKSSRNSSAPITAPTNGSPGPKGGSGSADDSPWLPNFVTGDSSKITSKFWLPMVTCVILFIQSFGYQWLHV